MWKSGPSPPRKSPRNQSGFKPRWSYFPAPMKSLEDLALTTTVAHLRTTRVTHSRVLNGKAGVSAAMAIRLAAALSTCGGRRRGDGNRRDAWFPASMTQTYFYRTVSNQSDNVRIYRTSKNPAC